MHTSNPFRNLRPTLYKLTAAERVRALLDAAKTKQPALPVASARRCFVG